MAKDYPEIVLTINPLGLEKIEVFAIEDDSDSETMGVEMYQQLAGVIYRWSKEAKEILHSHWENVRKQVNSVVES